jgi:hypothetical protein
MIMKTLLSLVSCLLSAPSFSAVVATPYTKYRSLADSPWYAAVATGDSLVYDYHTYSGSYTKEPRVTSIPDGYGMYENFEESGTFPWMTVSNEDYHSYSVDIDDGVLDYQGRGQSIGARIPQFGLAIQFTPTATGSLPKWFGFVSVGSAGTPYLEILGVDNSLTTVSLTSLVMLQNAPGPIPPNTVRDYFAGFISDVGVQSVTLRGSLRIDHFQYGYGAGPIPEPSALMLLGAGLVLGLSRRKR